MPIIKCDNVRDWYKIRTLISNGQYMSAAYDSNTPYIHIESGKFIRSYTNNPLYSLTSIKDVFPNPFQIGDKVKLKTEIYTDLQWIDGDKLGYGEVYTVKTVETDTITLKSKSFFHTYEAFELVESNKSVKTEFLAGEYVVILDSGSSSFPKGHIFKVRHDYYYLKVEKDCYGDVNGSSTYEFKDICNWRYATSDEIAIYQMHNKPVLVQLSSDDILKAELNYPKGTEFISPYSVMTSTSSGRFEIYGFNIIDTETNKMIFWKGTWAEIKSKITSKPEKGSGAVRPSEFNYILGTKIRITNEGGILRNSSEESGLKTNPNTYAKVGDEGTITGFNGSKTEIYLDKGVFVIRDEDEAWEYFQPLVASPKPDTSFKGSGVITSSSYGYNIGDRIEMTNPGGVRSTREFYTPNFVQCVKGDKGVITGVNGDYTEILLDKGGFVVRNEDERYQYFKPLDRQIEKSSSYGYKVGQRIVCTNRGGCTYAKDFMPITGQANIGDKGVIKEVNGDRTGILLDNGLYIVRDENTRYQHFVEDTSSSSEEIIPIRQKKSKRTTIVEPMVNIH
jgi:hypothetical protein